MIKYYFIAVLFLLAGCKAPNSSPGQYKLTGNVIGFKDSMVIYLDNEHGKVKDSAYIIKGHFEFTGTLSEQAEQVVLITKDENYKFLWVEPTDMTFQAKRGDFVNAKITGSKTQLLDDELEKNIAPIRRKMDSTKSEKEFETFDRQLREEYIKFIKKNPASVISVNALASYASQIGVSRTKILYHDLTDEMKATADGESVQQYLSLTKDIRIGEPFADLTQFDPQGNAIKLSDLKGNVILLDFWASWCHPCREENPNQLKNYNMYKDKGFKIYAVSVDNTKANWLDAIKKDGLTYTNVSEKNGEKNTAAIVYGIYQYPTNYLIDKNGIIIAKDLRGEVLTKTLKKIYSN